MTDYGCSDEVDANDERQEKWRLQRADRGFDDTELWNLDGTIASFIVPRLKAFKKTYYSFPANLTRSEWEVILDSIIEAFDEASKEEGITCDQEKIDKGLKLFAEYYSYLWN